MLKLEQFTDELGEMKDDLKEARSETRERSLQRLLQALREQMESSLAGSHMSWLHFCGQRTGEEAVCSSPMP